MADANEVPEGDATGKALALRKETPLERGDTQAVKRTGDGVLILVNHAGTFSATIGEVEVSGQDLADVEERAHKAFLAMKRKAAARIGRPCYAYGTAGSDAFRGHAFFRGFHAGNGDTLLTKPDGENVRASRGYGGDGVAIFRNDDPAIERLVALEARHAELVAAREAVADEIKGIVLAQRSKMWGERPNPDHPDNGGPSYYNNQPRTVPNRPKIDQDAATALEAAERVVANVWGADDA